MNLFTIPNPNLMLIMTWLMFFIHDNFVNSSSIMSNPRNLVVWEGAPAMLSCITSEPVNFCQWFYVAPGADTFDTRTEYELIREFTPKHNRDCTLSMAKTLRKQTGNWLCKVSNTRTNQISTSHVAFLIIVPTTNDFSREERHNITEVENTSEVIAKEKTNVIFSITEGDLATNVGERSIIEVDVNRQVQSCSWLSPSGIRHNQGEDTSMHRNAYKVFSDSNAGRCSIMISPVRPGDQGFWISIVRLEGELEERFGPTIFVYLEGFVSPGQNVRRPGTPDFGTNEQNAVKFSLSQIEHYTELNGEVTLECKINSPIEICWWLRPLEQPISSDEPAVPGYTLFLDNRNGFCSMVVSKFKFEDAGSWMCSVTLALESGYSYRRGPRFMLHLSGDVINQIEPLPDNYENPVDHTTGINLMSGLSIFLLILVFLLSLYIYKQDILPCDLRGKSSSDTHL